MVTNIGRMNKKKLLVLFAVLLSLSLFSFTPVASQKHVGSRFPLSAGKYYVFEYWVEKGEKVNWHWEIENPDRGTFPDKVKFYIRDPGGQVVYETLKRADISSTDLGSFVVENPGLHKFVWQNKNWFESISIRFEIRRVKLLPKAKAKTFPLAFDIVRFSIISIVTMAFFFPLVYLLRKTHILLKRGKVSLYSQVKWGLLDILWLLLFSSVVVVLVFAFTQKISPTAGLLSINSIFSIFPVLFVFFLVSIHRESFSNLGFRSFGLKEIMLIAPVLLIPLFAFEWAYDGFYKYFIGGETLSYNQLVIELVENEPLAGTLSVFLLAPVCEEIIFRGFLHQALRKHLRLLPGILLSSAIFSLAHINLPAFVPLLLVGIVLAYVFERTHSLLPCIAIHILNNGVALLPLLMPEIRILKL